jgi:hypothetical protein
MNTNLLFVKGATTITHRLKFGQPLVHLTALTERDIDLRHHMVTREEYNKYLQGEKLSNLNRYREYRRVRESEESKCPFGFGRKT